MTSVGAVASFTARANSTDARSKTSTGAEPTAARHRSSTPESVSTIIETATRSRHQRPRRHSVASRSATIGAVAMNPYTSTLTLSQIHGASRTRLAPTKQSVNGR